MLRTTALLFAALLLAAAADKPTTNTVPKDAVQVEPGVYRHTDDAGKKWLYKKTPFGYVKAADEETKAEGASPFGEVKPEASKAAVADGSDITRVTEDGETLRFERKSPFGSYKWSRKKSELNASEQEAWDRSRKSAPAGTK